jgi:hypothetical protein
VNFKVSGWNNRPAVSLPSFYPVVLFQILIIFLVLHPIVVHGVSNNLSSRLN